MATASSDVHPRKMNLPIACTLSDAERALASDELLSGLMREARAVEPEGEGYRATFSGVPGRVTRVARVIERERGCCKFLMFDLHASANDGDIVLTMSGPPGTRDVLDTLMAS